MVDIVKRKNWKAVSEIIGIPERYVGYLRDDDGLVPYRRLFEDIRQRPHTRSEAMLVVRKQAPSEIKPWLDYVEAHDDWMSLYMCGADSNEEVERRLLVTAARWAESLSDGGDD